MARCRFCNYKNPPAASTCGKCGASFAIDHDDQRQVPNSSSEADPAPAQAGGIEGQVLTLLRAGRKIQAIKRYRELTGAGLREAKDRVESLAEEHNISADQGSGCAAAVLVALGLGGAAWVMIGWISAN